MSEELLIQLITIAALGIGILKSRSDTIDKVSQLAATIQRDEVQVDLQSAKNIGLLATAVLESNSKVAGSISELAGGVHHLAEEASRRHQVSDSILHEIRATTETIHSVVLHIDGHIYNVRMKEEE